MKRTFLAVLIAAHAALTPLSAQQPRFRSGVDLVVVDVNAVNEDGQPVQGLKASDFSVTVDGKPRRVVSATFVSDAPVASREAAAAAAAAPTPAQPYSSNETSRNGRLILLAIDEDNIRAGAGRAAMAAAQRFLDQLQPADRVALFVFPNGPSAEFTLDHARVRELVGKVVGRQSEVNTGKNVGLAEAFDIVAEHPGALDAVYGRECTVDKADKEAQQEACRAQIEFSAHSLVDSTLQRTRTSLATLRQLLLNLQKIDGPKTVILVSEALVLGGGTTEEFSVAAQVLHEIGRAAAAARVTVYALRLDPGFVDAMTRASLPTRSADEQLRAEGLASLAGATRGTLFNVVGSADRVFSRITLELSGHYLLAFEAAGTDHDGKAHGIDVRIARPGVHLRARRDFIVAAEEAAMTDEAALRRVLGSPLTASEVPLHVATYLLGQPQGEKVRLLIAADIGRDLTSAQQVAVAVVVQDVQGKVRANSFERVSLAPRHAPGALAYQAAATVDPGEYTLRVAVRDKDGHLGSVERHVSARLTPASALQSSDLVLADEDASAPGRWRPDVDGRVAGQLAVYLELYSADKDALRQAAVRLEVAEDDRAPALLTGEAHGAEAQGARRAITGRVGLDLLPPGRYVARAVVTVADRTIATATRAFERTEPADSPTGTSGKTVTVAFADLTRRFDVKQVIDPAVLNPILDRLVAQQSRALPPSAREAIERARRGAFDGPAEAGGRDLATTFVHGVALLSRGDTEAAAGEFRTALRLSSDFFPAAFYLGACYAAGGQDEQAVGAWQMTLAGESDLRIAHVVLFDALVRLGDLGQAFETAQDGLAQWPDDGPLQRRAVAVLVMRGADGEALAALRKYLAGHGDDEEALLLAMRLIMQHRLHGHQAAGSQRDDFQRYAQMYRAAHGKQQPLVEVWARYMSM